MPVVPPKLKVSLLEVAHEGLRRTASGLQRVNRLVLELALALQSPELEAELTRAYAGHVGVYASEGHLAQGLYPFEERALERFFPPPPARIFVPGAGAGREAEVLLDRGYSVDAIEPVRPLCDVARRELGNRQSFNLVEQSLQEWCRGSPAQQGPYAGVLTGWTLWSHLPHRADRLEALSALRRACPRGPILLSFWRSDLGHEPSETEPSNAIAGRLQWLTRQMLRERLLHLGPVEPGTGWSQGHYVHWVSERELREEATAAHLQVDFFEQDARRYASAVLRAV